ncbi:MAG: adenylate/guanylate cyclase domain-containing protein [Eudoraea sp.]|nr:adenylate/guanylate cyclase domain-containing protein [Eudoraea sp.]
MGSSCSNIKPFKIKVFLLLCFSLFYCFFAYTQNKIVSDSLESVYTQGNYEVGDKLKILKALAINHTDPDKKLLFSEQLIKEAQALDSTDYLFNGFLEKGNSLKLKGNLSEALEAYFEGAKNVTANEITSKELSQFYISIAGVYASMDNEQNTISYYKNAIQLLSDLEDREDSINYASAIENLGDTYNLQFRKPDSALLLFRESEAIWKGVDSKLGMAYNLGNIGLAYAQQGKITEAETKIQDAISMLEELGDYYPICVYLTYMADINADRNDWKWAFEYANRSLHLAKQHGLKEQIGDAYLKLSELYERRGDEASSLAFYKDFITYKDSVQNITAVHEMADLRTDFEVYQKQIEYDLLNQKRKNQRVINIAASIIAGLTIILSLTLFWYYKAISKEKKISENLLLNILPSETAEELKRNGRVQAQKFDSVTVLFTDFKGFTKLAGKLSPEKLVERVDHYFSKFDEIMEKYHLEKVKTIGDSYMCVGGLHSPKEEHAQRMVLASIEIANFVNECKKQISKSDVCFDMRIGINTGPVVAGVVGTNKFAYDIWGDTVNIASRMQSNSEIGRINVSENTYELVKDTFECEYRGKFEVKNMGLMKMYFVKGMK